MKTHYGSAQAPIVILATRIIEDISEWCSRMAVINRHEGEPEHVPTARETNDKINGAKRGR